jgi:tetratricopeptide (TPR) repeat protein
VVSGRYFYFAIGVLLAACAGWFAFRWAQSLPLTEARLAFAVQNYEIAAQLAEAQLQSKPGDPEAILLAARSYARRNRWPEAEAYFTQIQLRDAEDFMLRARGLEARQLWSEAAWVYEQMLQKWPNNGNAIQHMAAIRSQQGRDQEATILAQRLIQMPSHQVVGYVIAGLIEFRMQNSIRAVELIEKAVAVSPELEGLHTDRAKVFEWLAEGLVELGRPEDAERYALKVRDLSVEPGPCFVLGRARQQLGDEDGAMSCWKEALARDPNHVPSIIEIARIHLRRMDPQEALRWAMRAQQLEPNSTVVTYLMTTIERMLEQQKKPEDAAISRSS